MRVGTRVVLVEGCSLRTEGLSAGHVVGTTTLGAMLPAVADLQGWSVAHAEERYHGCLDDPMLVVYFPRCPRFPTGILKAILPEDLRPAA
jgi:hypothetical protein